MTLDLVGFLDRPGYRLAVRGLDVQPPAQCRGTVLIVHGLGEHGGRYAHVAQVLQKAHWRVCAYDHYGHGQSDGERGDLRWRDQLVDDLAAVVDGIPSALAQTLHRPWGSSEAPGHPASGPLAPGGGWASSSPLVVLGHSMGGLVVVRAVQQRRIQVSGVVLSSPALAAHTTPLQRLLLAVLPRWAPRLRVDNGVAVDRISRDPTVVQAYRDDPWVHRKICARLAAWIMGAGRQAVAQAPDWSVPALLLYAGQDGLVDRRGSDALAAGAPPAWLESHCYETLFHEIFNEPQRDQPLGELVRWLDGRVPQPNSSR